MKQFLFIAAAASIALVSCTQDEGVNPVSSDDLVPIQIGLSAPSALTTRGTGTVGTTDAETSTWDGQKVKVYMFEKASLVLATNNDGSEIFNNASFTTPVGVASGEATFDGTKVNYYPISADKAENYDFWGYRTDGAETSDPAADADDAESATKYTVPFTIDGSQDMMVAKADGTVDAASADIANFDADRTYSAYSARHGVKPNLEFKHVLTRLVFQGIAGKESVCDTVKVVTENTSDEGVVTYDTAYVANNGKVEIVSVMVKSNTTGEMVVAYTDAAGITIAEKDYPKELVTWTTDSADLYLQQRAEGASDSEDVEALTPVALANKTYVDNGEGGVDVTAAKAVAQQIGEALLVAPADNYEVVINFRQLADTDKSGNKEYQTFSQKATLKLADGSAFKTGHSYTTTIVVYGLEKIDLITTLTPWADGGETEDLNPDITGYE